MIKKNVNKPKNPSISKNIKTMQDLKNIKYPDKAFYESRDLLRKINKLSYDKFKDNKINSNKFDDILKRREIGFKKLKTEYNQKRFIEDTKRVIEVRIIKKLKIFESHPEAVKELIDLPKEYASKQKANHMLDNFVNKTKQTNPGIISKKDEIVFSAYKLAFKKDKKIYNAVLFSEAVDYVHFLIKEKSKLN